MATRAAIYQRISDDRAGQGLGVARQEADNRAEAERHGWPVVAVFTDNDVSAYSGKRRPAYERLMDAIRSGEVDAVVAWHPDRLHRSPKELESFIDLLEAHDVAVATCKAGTYDLTTPAGRMTARVVGATARYESEHKSDRQKRKALELAQAGEPSGGGSRPFGYTSARREEIVDHEAEVIRGAAELLVDGASQMEVVRWMNKYSTSAEGKPWTLTRMRVLLDSASIAGIREHHAKDPVARRGTAVPGNWPAIIDQPTHERLRAILSHRRPRRAGQTYLLTGFATCGLCGAVLHAQPRPGGVRSYRCPQPGNGSALAGCGKIRIQAEPFEQYVVGQALAFATSPDAIAARAVELAKAEGEEAELRGSLAAVGRKLEHLADLALEDALPAAQVRRKRQELEAEQERLERRLDRLSGALSSVLDRGHAEEVHERWGSLTLNQQRDVIRTLLSRVVVHPGVPGRNIFDTKRVEVAPDWRPAMEKAASVDPSSLAEAEADVLAGWELEQPA